MYCVEFWSHHFQEDRGKLEKVQTRVTKITGGTKSLSHEERSKRLRQFTEEVNKK